MPIAIDSPVVRLILSAMASRRGIWNGDDLFKKQRGEQTREASLEQGAKMVRRGMVFPNEVMQCSYIRCQRPHAVLHR